MVTNALRLAIVTPRYWPQVGDVELFAARLSEDLAAVGAHPRIVSAKWSANWPDLMQVREVDVQRIAHAPRGGWNTFRYLINISRWLREHRSAFDAVYVLNLRHEAYAAVRTLREAAIPLVLRCHDAGPQGDCAWQMTSRFGDRLRRMCQLADAVMATTSLAADELDRLGYRRDRIHLDPGGVPRRAIRSADRRYRARAALADAQHDLAVAEYAPVIVSVGRLDHFALWTPVLQAWRDIAARWPSARLWLIGDGAARDALREQIAAWDLRYQVFLPGSFEDLSDIWYAADLLVVPRPHGQWQVTLEAMAAGLPVVGTDCAEMRALVDVGQSGMLVPAADREAWREAISYFCEHPAAAVTMGKAAQRSAQRQFGIRHSTQRHLELFERLVHRKANR